MNLKMFLFTLFFMLLCLYNIYAQSIDEIKNSRGIYLWGEGSGTTLSKAENEALSMLINQISTQVESNFSVISEETKHNKKANFKESVNAVLHTYSNATLRNTERIVISHEPDARIFLYIKKEEVDKIFKERADKIRSFALNGEKFETRNEIAYALRYYYWALSLLRSHPEANSLTITLENGNKALLINWLDEKINRVFANLDFQFVHKESTDGITFYTLNVLHKKAEVKNFDFSYWTGKDWSNIHSAKNGKALIEFASHFNTDEIKLKAEYIFENEANVDAELRDVLRKTEVVFYKNSYFTLKEKKQEQVTTPSNTYEHFTPPSNEIIYASAVNTLIQAIKSNKYLEAEPLFTAEAFDLYKNLLMYGKAKVIGTPDLRFIAFENGVMCRAIPMSFHFQNNNRVFTEDLILHFNEQNKISNLSFGLSATAIADIASKNMWDENVRLVLINFLENYKTAYALKRLDYIESIFDDNALIIVGSVLKNHSKSEVAYLENKIVQYNRYSKEEYIKNLKHSFAGKEYINIRFEDNIVRKSGKGGEIYGIQIKQDYFSSNYGDSGYLFLLIDVNDTAKPIIHVRTWQPQKNADGSIYGLEDF